MSSGFVALPSTTSYEQPHKHTIRYNAVQTRRCIHTEKTTFKMRSFLSSACLLFAVVANIAVVDGFLPSAMKSTSTTPSSLSFVPRTCSSQQSSASASTSIHRMSAVAEPVVESSTDGTTIEKIRYVTSGRQHRRGRREKFVLSL